MVLRHRGGLLTWLRSNAVPRWTLSRPAVDLRGLAVTVDERRSLQVAVLLAEARLALSYDKAYRHPGW
jgi:hypothetical protein